jgi:amino acid adenylation domain-containing protein
MLRVTPGPGFVPFPRDDVTRSVPDRFESIVRRYPRRLAVKDQDRQCTYEELNGTANRMSHAVLAACGAQTGAVALLLEQSVPAIAALLGVLKAGKAYVPLNPLLPPARLVSMLEDVSPQLLVTDDEHLGLAKSVTGDGPDVLSLDALPAALSTENPGLALSPDTLSEVLYTSGSTGRPKGVMHTHESVLHHCMRVTNYLCISPDDRITLFASLGTGQARSTMYRALLNGAVLYPRHLKAEGLAGLAGWLMQEEITVYYSSATIFRAFVDTLTGRESFPRLRLLRVGDESVAPVDVEHYRAHFPPECLLINSLSSTETGTIRMFLMNHETPIDGRRVPVGYAVEGMDVLLLDEHGAAVGVNQPGEIVVRSCYLSSGYWRQPELTGAAFVPDPDGGEASRYRTGDLGRMLPDGCLLHLGRRDFQVKIRGHRVEVTEVEEVLRRHPALKEAVVTAQPHSVAAQHLVAYVVPAEEPGPTVPSLRDFVRQVLPDYMVPAAFVQLTALPLTPSGKVDRQRLPAPEPLCSKLADEDVAARTPIEEELVRLWATMLGVDQVGVSDTFQDLGGDSLTAMRLVARVQEIFRTPMPFHTLLQSSTVAEMAMAITHALASQVEPAAMARWLAEAEETTPPLGAPSSETGPRRGLSTTPSQSSSCDAGSSGPYVQKASNPPEPLQS